MLVWNGYLKIDKVEIPLKDGSTAVREVMRTKDAVAVLCRVYGTEKYLFVKQFRAPTNGDVVEVVAGGVEAGEDPVTSAKREVEEELGRKVLTIDPQGWAWSSPGITTEKIYYFSAVVSEEVFPQSLDHGEEVEIVEYPVWQIRRMLEKDQITDAKTMILVMKGVGC